MFAKTALRVLMSLALALPVIPVTATGEGSPGSKRSITFHFPRMQPAIVCKRSGCYESSIPVEGQDWIRARDGMEVYTYRRTGQTGSNGGMVYSESLERDRPGGLDPATVDSSVIAERPGVAGHPPTRLVYSLGDQRGIGGFLREYGRDIGAGMGGALNYFEREQQAQAHQAQAAAELDRAFNEGRAVNGRYVQAATVAVSQLKDDSNRESESMWSYIGQLGRSSGSSTNLTEVTRFQTIAGDPYAVRDYVLNDEARALQITTVRGQLRAGNFGRVATEFEALQYDRSNSPLPDDLRQLLSPADVLVFENYDPQLPASPLSATLFRTAKNSDWGQIVRRLANQYQATWSESRGLADWSDQSKAQYLAGLGYLRSADNDLASSLVSGVVDLQIADILLMSSKGFVSGAVNGVTDLIRSVPELAGLLQDFASDLVRNPAAISDKAMAIYENLPMIRDAIWAAAAESWEKAKNGSAEERGEIAGRLAFEVGLIWITGGLGAAAEGTEKSARALNMASRSIKGLGEKFLARSNSMKTALNEVAKMPKELRSQLLRAGAKDPRRMYEGFGLYREALQGGLKDPAEIVEVALKSSSRGSSEFLRLAARSKSDAVHAAKYFNDSQDARRLIKQYERLETALSKEAPVTLEGYQARAGTKARFETNPGGVMDRHPGNIEASGRMALKGQFGQSFGFGSDAAEAGRVATTEMASYGHAESELIFRAEKFKTDSALDVTRSDLLERLNLNARDLRLDRGLANAYETTHILGHVARRQGFSGILAESAVTNGKVFHWLK